MPVNAQKEYLVNSPGADRPEDGNLQDCEWILTVQGDTRASLVWRLADR